MALAGGEEKVEPVGLGFGRLGEPWKQFGAMGEGERVVVVVGLP